MLNPSEIVDSLVTALQTIEPLVDELNGEPDRIYAYRDAPPRSGSLSQGIFRMKSPGVMVAWNGTSAGAEAGPWAHSISLFVRARDYPFGNIPSYANVITLIVNGLVTSEGGQQKLLDARIHPLCDPMQVPTIERIHDEEGTIDIFEISTTFNEIGDN